MKKNLLIAFLLISQIFFSQADCVTAIAVCGNANITYTPSGPGAINETLGGCLQVENNSTWYSFTIATGGTLTFEINPTGPVDYDWAIYGPNKTCATKGTPIRCSSNDGTIAGYPTGMNMTATDTSEGPGFGDGFVKYLDVLPGETYFLYVDNFSTTVFTFNLVWGGTATLASPFTDPLIQPHPFNPPGIPAANPADPREIIVCSNPAVFDFSTLSTGILNGNPNFNITYHTTQNDALSGNNAILTPITINTATTYYYSISYTDPANPNNPINKCRQTGNFKFKDGTITGNDVTLTACNNNNMGTAVFDLTSANVIGLPNVTKKYYLTMNDLNAGINEIINPSTYISSAGVVYVKITSQFGCIAVAKITLNFYPPIVVQEATLRSCFIETNPSTASFNLTAALVTPTGPVGLTKKYYPSLTDAINGTNQIATPAAYIAPNGVVYVRVSNSNNCFTVAKITLIVLPPVKSSVLVDKIICMEDTTTLDAGPGFASYLWSTGAITQAVTNVSVGTYWVKLKTGECITTQTVKVYPTEQPVISNVDISTNTITVNVVGGTPAYKYSLDNITWQDSNVFNNVPRGDCHIYVKDIYDCEPIDITITVPNLVNVITPNSDGINDVIDYSALAHKQNLILNIFDRYGNKVHQADKTNGYKWDGTTNGSKKVPTGTYWYSVTWSENDKKNTPVKFSSWIMVKNRE
ncbi:gliding motility-associated C-terminal domain-containing protein [Chryseobacterium sp. ISL-6]|uniref:T9SS type B sorting domain-containing protein n=1 Tax=Chryseobacterium sp. ISL-6 TaxID=2819143 RepID=UPI001BE99B5B|nr:gliding motility-associated C-terminal domain-containing protein [Chryseobacterium sp. ISL-6]MBT2621046.1 gliding motility-associated C-terminal domain-containing protein [Chryseobacterium sp. ISL-6]